MSDNHSMMHRFSGIAFLGNYPPRACGISTFTHDLASAVARQAGNDQPVIVAAMNDLPEGYSYPDVVKFELRQDYPVDYSRAADFLNFSHIDIVSLQHEYAIYGGEYGANVLTFLRDLNRPAVVTCHTVLEHPNRQQKEVLAEIADHSERLVVMCERARGFLEDAYGIRGDKLAVIPHGIHDAPFIDPNYYKDKFGVEGRRVLLTFGLLAPTKGIEYMIEALPRIVERHPKTTYVILGATHPAVVRMEGESYRLSLQRRVRELGLEGNVLFYPRFVDLDELLQYLGAADIFITPYLNREQITSGALAYAMGAGKAVVSTEYWHAEELLADGRGCLVGHRDSDALATAVIDLLDDEVKLNAMRKRAYIYCRSMVWSAIARDYLNLFDEVRSRVPARVPIASAMRSPIASTNLPLVKLDHLLRLTDDTGPAHHARYAVPDWGFGYSLGDTAATLVASTKFNAIHKHDDAQRLAETYLALLQTLIGDGDHREIADGLDYTRQKVGRADDASVGKAIWALGYVVWRGPDHLAVAANDLFHQILPPGHLGSARAAAYAALGASNYLQSFPGASAVRRFLRNQLMVVEDQAASATWHEELDCADWPVLAQATGVAAASLHDDDLRALAKELVTKACEITSNGTVFYRLGANPDGEELPATAAAFIEALCASFLDTRDSALLDPIRSAVDWFLGANRAEAALYHFATGGCHDALLPTGLNRNLGTEATAFCLLAFLSLNKIMGLPGSTDDSKKSLRP